MSSRAPQRDISQTFVVRRKTIIYASSSTMEPPYIPCSSKTPFHPISSPAVSSQRVREMCVLTSPADNFIDNVGDHAQRWAGFQKEFWRLSSPQQQILRESLQGGCFSNLPLSRAKPCDRAQNANELLTMIKTLVSPEHCSCALALPDVPSRFCI